MTLVDQKEEQPEFDITPTLNMVAVRLADEGIPVRAIARGTQLASSDVYEVLRTAIESGVIIGMPKDDWPIGSKRAERALLAADLADGDAALRFACARVFKATKLEAAIFSLMLKRNEVTKQQLHMVIEQNRVSDTGRDETDPKMVDVIICHLRKKLRRWDIEIETIWGIGYKMTTAMRDRAVEVLNDNSDPQVA